MKTVALVDPFWGGHHPMYLRYFSEALLQLGHRVMVFCSEPEKLYSLMADLEGTGVGTWEALRYQLPANAEDQNSRWDTRSNQSQRLRSLAEVLTAAEQSAKTTIDLVFLSYLDPFLGGYQTAGDVTRWLGRPVSGLYFLPTHLRVKMPWHWARWGPGNPLNPDAVLASPSFRSVAVLDEAIAAKLSRKLGGKKVICFPDVTDERCSEAPTALEMQVLQKAAGRKIVGLIGSLCRHKGLLRVIQLAAETEQHPVCYLVAGQVDERAFSGEENQVIKNFMENPSANVFTYAGFIQDEKEYNSLVRCCDLLYAVYTTFYHSANTLTKAACMQTPIAVSNRYLMGERVKRFNLGFLVREDVPADFRALLSSEKTFALRSTAQFKEGCQDYLREHGRLRLLNCFQQVLEA